METPGLFRLAGRAQEALVDAGRFLLSISAMRLLAYLLMLVGCLVVAALGSLRFTRHSLPVEARARGSHRIGRADLPGTGRVRRRHETEAALR